MAFIQQSGGISYFQDTVTITSGALPASASNIAVPSLTYTITEAGNYVIFSMISVDIGGQDAKPFGVMLYKNGVLIPNSLTVDFAKKNEGQSIQLTYPIDGLIIGDVIAVYANNDNIVSTVLLGRMLIQKWA